MVNSHRVVDASAVTMFSLSEVGKTSRSQLVDNMNIAYMMLLQHELIRNLLPWVARDSDRSGIKFEGHDSRPG